MLPVNERPETTEGYEGFYHLVSVQGNVTTTKMKYFIRDFDRRSFDARAQKLRDIAEEMNKKYGEGKVEVEIVESYYNMREKIEPCMQLIDYAKAAIEHAGITPIVSPVVGEQTVQDSASKDFRVRILERADMHSMAYLSISR